MSGPKTVEYTILDSIADAWAEHQAEQQRRMEELARTRAAAEAERLAALERREAERKAREAARLRAERATALLAEAHAAEQRLVRTRDMVERARAAYPADAIDIPVAPPAAPDRSDPESIERYLAALAGTVAEVEQRLREATTRAAGNQGLRELMGAISQSVAAQPSTAAELLDVYARQLRAEQPAAAGIETRRATAERILGRLAGEAASAIPADLERLMADMIGAESEARAQLVGLELRARVQRLNEAREAEARLAAENRKRELAGEIVADALADLGYEVEPVANTLFVEGGVAHFQRAEWGDYYVRMRVDPATRSLNLNMVRTAQGDARTDPTLRRRDEEMETAWCAGLPRLLDELAARGIDTKKLRALDPGALPVQAVKPEAVAAALRERRRVERRVEQPKAMERPIK